MAWMIGSADGYKDCLSQVRDFCKKSFEAGSVTHTTGSVGDLFGASAGSSSVAEDWEVKCATAGADGTAKFNVTGSVSGLLGTQATAGEPYSDPKVSFIVIAGDGNSFSINDQFDFSIAASTAVWSDMRWDTDCDDDATNQYEWIAKGIGAGSDEIFVGFRTHTNNTTYWNLQVAGLTGFVDHESGSGPRHPIEDQPGYQQSYTCMNGPGTSMPFVCIFTSRHIKIIPQPVSDFQGSVYVGWFLPFSTASQYPYPMFVGGSTDDANQTMVTESDHTCYWAVNTTGNGWTMDGVSWRRIITYSPRHYTVFNYWYPGFDGYMRLYPAIPIYESTNMVFGELEGVYYPNQWVPDEGALSAGDVIATDSMATLVFKDADRVSTGSLIAMELIGD
jgi:hypothetical protein